MTNPGEEKRPSGAADQDPYQEPENSTVEDWLGQRVQRDEARADELLEESDGDPAEAEERFGQVSDEGDEYRAAHEQGR